MTLSSLSFLFFLPAVFFGFHLLKSRSGWAYLLLASVFFYATLQAPHLLAVLALVILTTFGCGLRLGRLAAGAHRRMTLVLGISTCVVVLAVAKYGPQLFAGGPAKVFPAFPLVFVGVSYFVLQAISYLFDVYAGRIEPERHLGYYALYLAFFPKLLQGPIERAGSLLPELKKPYVFDYESIRIGVVQYTWGLFKKVVVADRLALFVDPIYSDVHSYAGVALLSATYLYAIQIYCDFSGYTDMALGIGRLFNISLTQNFRAPYFATSVADFWRRWHISLSNWLRDYLFLPLSYFLSDRIDVRTVLRVDTNVVIYCFSIVVTFLIAGIWHGGAWTYVVWGLLHGLYLASSNLTRRARKAFRKRIRRYRHLAKPLALAQGVFTFHLVVLSWVFFRAGSLADSRHVFTAILADVQHFLDIGYVRLQFRGLGLRETDLLLVAALAMVVLVADVFGEAAGREPCDRLLSAPRWVRWVAYYGLVFCILYLTPYNSAANYIYMQF